MKLVTIASGTITESSEYVASLQSRRSVTLLPQVSGNVTKILVRSGDRVAAQAPLIQIDPARQAASVASFNAAAASDSANLTAASDTLRSLQAQRSAKVANLKFSQSQFQRYTTLYADGAVTKQDLDDFTNRLQAAQSDLDALDQQIRAQQSAVASAARVVQEGRANVQEQQVQLNYYAITAPFAGIVGDIPVKIGDYVTTATRLTTVTQNQPLEVYVSIPIEYAPQLRSGTLVQLMDGNKQVTGAARVFFISPKVDNNTQTVLVKALYDNTGDRLRADQYVQVRVVWNQRPGVLIPTSAVTNIAGQNFVFVAQASPSHSQKLVARQKPVKLGTIEGNQYQVLQGLQPGEKLVISGIQKLADQVPLAPES
ncbi:efflux RND transporter periplasmic adaptor subunit [Neosynechococcus sphagnicola]|uniref:efflux RND transporter periplasmic adaptor subunit n=1 Tax=Neosynechococcus sphagnicola TaxID=1501145 RepID=UPI0006899A0A|nr:efflux RND transporter periplasmic adaptor subunit [Neosynechococcus sphagnicola]